MTAELTAGGDQWKSWRNEITGRVPPSQYYGQQPAQKQPAKQVPVRTQTQSQPSRFRVNRSPETVKDLEKQFNFGYVDSSGRFKLPQSQIFQQPSADARAGEYAMLEPNAQAPQPWLEAPEVMGARRRPLYEQLPYMPQEQVTPEMVPAYEEMKPSTVYSYLPAEQPTPPVITGSLALDQYLAKPYEPSEDDFGTKRFAEAMKRLDRQRALKHMHNRYRYNAPQQPKSYKNLWGRWK